MEKIDSDLLIGKIAKKLMKNPITWIIGLFLFLLAIPLAMMKVIGITFVASLIGLLSFFKGRVKK